MSLLVQNECRPLKILYTQTVNMPPSSVSSQVRGLLDPQAGWPGRYINVRRCRGLSMVLLRQKDPLELFVRVGNFLPVPGFYLVAIIPKLLKAT